MTAPAAAAAARAPLKSSSVWPTTAEVMASPIWRVGFWYSSTAAAAPLPYSARLKPAGTMTAAAALPSSTRLRAAAARGTRVTASTPFRPAPPRMPPIKAPPARLARLRGRRLVQVREGHLGGGDLEAVAAAAEGEAQQAGQRQRRHQHHHQRRHVARRAAQVLQGDGEDLASRIASVIERALLRRARRSIVTCGVHCRAPLRRARR